MRVNVDTPALLDTRFARLGLACGTDKYGALGRCIFVWHECQQRGVDELTNDEVDAAAGTPGFATAMVAADLAVGRRNGRVRIKGATERVDDINKARAQGKFGELGAKHGAKGGRPRKNQAPDNNPPQGVLETPRGGGSGNPLLALALALALKDQSQVRFDLGEPETERAKDCAQLWEYQEDLRARVIPGCRRLRPTPERLGRVLDRLASHTAGDCRYVLEVYADEARRNPEKSAQWFNGETNWRKDNFDRALGKPPPRALQQKQRAVAEDPDAEERRLNAEILEYAKGRYL